MEHVQSDSIQNCHFDNGRLFGSIQKKNLLLNLYNLQTINNISDVRGKQKERMVQTKDFYANVFSTVIFKMTRQ